MMLLLSFMGSVLTLTGFMLVFALRARRQPPTRDDSPPRDCGCQVGCAEHLYQIREPERR